MASDTEEALEFVGKLADVMKAKGLTRLEVVDDDLKYSLEMQFQPVIPYVEASKPEPIEDEKRGDDGLTESERRDAYASSL